jgi:hypothetical protein
VGRQRERTPERAVPDLAIAATVADLGPLVAPLTLDDERSLLDLDGHVLGRVQPGQLHAHDRVVAVTVELSGRREARADQWAERPVLLLKFLGI